MQSITHCLNAIEWNGELAEEGFCVFCAAPTFNHMLGEKIFLDPLDNFPWDATVEKRLRNVVESKERAMQCYAVTTKGYRCKAEAYNGGDLCAYHTNRIRLLGPEGVYTKENGKVTRVTVLSEEQWREKSKGMRAEDV